MDREVLVTGSSGWIGRAVAARLIASGVPVRGVDRVPGPLTTCVGDLVTLDLGRVVDGCHAIVHAAALHAPHVATATAQEFESVNVHTTSRLLERSSLAAVDRFVFLSSTSVYGRALERDDEAVWVDEALTPVPRDVYDTTKLAAEDAVRAAHGAALSTLTLRIARCFPETHRSTVTHRLSRGLDRRDATDAIVAAVGSAAVDHHVLNVAGPRVFHRTDVARLRRDAPPVIDQRLPWLRDEFGRRGWPLPATIDRVYVSDRAAGVLGSRPRFGVRSALDDPGQVAPDEPPAASGRGALPTAC